MKSSSNHSGMQQGSNQKMKISRGLSLYTSLSKYYIEDFMKMSKCYKRSFNVSIALLIIKVAQQFAVLFNIKTAQNVSAVESYFTFIEDYNLQKYLNDNQDVCTSLVYFSLSFNLLILIYIFAKFINCTIITSVKSKKLKLLNFIEEKDKARTELSKSINEIVFSMIFQTYSYLIMIPSLIVSSILMDHFASINITLTILIAMLISNNEFDYMITSKDALRQKYIDFQIFFTFFETMAYFLVVIINSQDSMILLWLLIVIELMKLILLQPLFDKQIQIISIFFQIYLFLFIITCYALIKLQNDPSHLLSLFSILYIPISYKISLQIGVLLNDYNFQRFQERLNSNVSIGGEILNLMVRKISLKEDIPQKQQNMQEIQYISFVIKNNDIQYQQSRRELEIAMQQQRQKENNFNKSEQIHNDFLFDEQYDSLLGEYEADTKHFEGKDYIEKGQVFGSNATMKKEINLLFNDLFLNERNKKEFGLIDIYYLVFIVEVLQNYQLFEWTMMKMSKSISIKYQQILNSIMIEVENRKNTMHLESDDKLIFGSSFYEALVYDELILSTQANLEDAVFKKVFLLIFMKQKFINLEELQIHLDELLRLREELIESITLMIKVNEYSSRLYDLYLNYLETLSFSESDIRLERFNRYQKNQRQIFFELNSSDACVLFTSLKNEKDMKITKVSNNISSFLGYEKDHLIGNSIESIMPLPYAEHHRSYIINFLERGDTQSYLNQQLLFALSQSNHIIAVSVEIKVNMIAGEKEFGITAYLQRNQKQKQYILFDAASSRLISMSSEINQFVFPQLKNFNRVSLAPYFPFIQHFRQIFASNSSNPFSKGSQMTLNSVKSRQFASNYSIRSHQNEQQGSASKNIIKNKIGQNEVKINKQQQQSAKNIQNNEGKEMVKSPQQNQLKKEIMSGKNGKQKNNETLKYIQKQETNKQNMNEMYEESDDRRYRNIQYLLIINKTQVQNVSMKSRSVNGLSEYLFFTMNIDLFTSTNPGLDYVKYIEISQIKQISPLYNSKLILSIYNDEADGFLTNFHSLRSSDIQCIVSELELKGFKDSNRYNEKPAAIDQLDEEGSELLNSKHENQELLYNRYASKEQVNMDPNEQELASLQRNANNVSQKEQLLAHEMSYSFVQNVMEDNQNEKQVVKKEKKISLDYSQFQLLKSQSGDQTQSFQGIGGKYGAKDLNSSEINGNYQNANESIYPNGNLLNMDASNYQGNDISEMKQIVYPFTPVSPNQQTTQNTPQSQQQYAVFFKFNTVEQNQNLEQAKKVGVDQQNSHKANVFSPKADVFSPKDQSSHQLMIKSTTMMMSPQPNTAFTQKLYATFASQDKEMPTPNMLMTSQNPQILQSKGMKKTKTNNLHPSEKNTQSVMSLSKKRKKIQVKHKKEIKNIKDALDSSSNHSRESAQSSTRQATKTIILQKFTLGIMRVVNLIGVVSFLIIIIVVLQQYLSMSSQFNSYAQDLNFINWSPKYQLTVYQARKNYDISNFALEKNLIVSTDANQQSQFISSVQTDLINFVIDLNNLLIKLTLSNPDRQIISRMLNTNYIFKMVQIVDRSLPLLGQTSNNYYHTGDMNISLYTGAYRVYTYFFRYSRNLGLGLAQWVVVNNSEAIVKSLLIVAQECQDFSIQQLSSIEGDVDNVLIIICLVSAFCIFIIIPVYSFIQTKREQIIQLFGTFNSQFIDTIIHEIQKMYSKNNNIKQLSVDKMNSENQKRQNLSSTSRLTRINKKIIVMAFIIFFLTLPYPILNKVLSQDYIAQNKDTLPMLRMLYNVQSFAVEIMAMDFFIIRAKFTPNSPYQLSNYVTYFQSNLVKIDTIQVDLQTNLKNFLQVKMFDQTLSDNFFINVFEDNICDISNQYPSLFQVQNATFTQSGCQDVYNGILKQGLTISLRTYLDIFKDLQVVVVETDIPTFKQEFQLFLQRYDIRDILLLSDYIGDIIEAQAQFLMQQSNAHKAYLENILLGLLLYQLLMMCMIFYFGWILFYKAMDGYLHKTKLYLALLNINYLVANPYIQNYLHKSLT